VLTQGQFEHGMRIGVDLGGSKYRIGLVNSNAELVGESIRISVDDISEADVLVSSISEIAVKLLNTNHITRENVKGMGIGSPGPINIGTGMILDALNLDYLNGYPLADELKQLLSMEVSIGNDATCFVLGQQIAGAAKGYQNVFGITLGTGYGCGIIVDGKLYEGSTGTAGEYARSLYLEGIFEDYISGRGLKSIYKNLSGESSRPFLIEDAAREGDQYAIQTFEEFGFHIGSSLSYIVNLLDPSIIVIGGSIAHAYDLFIESLKGSLLSKIHDRPAKKLIIKQAVNGEENALIGAAMLSNSRKANPN